MPKHALTALSLKSKLDAATTESAQTGKLVRIPDGGGLYLNVRPHGSAWILRYQHEGARRDLTIGRWPTVTLKMARDAADEARKGLHEGVDPVVAKAEKRDEKRILVVSPPSMNTVRSLFDSWMLKLAAEGKSEVYRGNIEAALLKDVLPVIGTIPPEQVTREQILAILRVIEGRNALDMVRRVRMWLRQIFEYGIEHEGFPLLKLSPVPMGTLRSFAQAKDGHFPALTNAADVAPLLRKIRGIQDNWIIRNAFMLSAHCWQRPSEIRFADWSEFDLDIARWIIPAERMKGRMEHWVPLSRQVVALLRHHQGIVGSAGFLFPGRRYEKPISEGTLTSRLNSMGYFGLHSPHGFRAMARTILDEHLKVDSRFMEKQLAHENDTSGLKGAYNRAQYWDERVKMMQKWSDWLDTQV